MSVTSLREVITKVPRSKAEQVEMQGLVDKLIQKVREEEQEALPKCSVCNTSLDFRFNWRYSNRKNIWWCESCMDKPNPGGPVDENKLFKLVNLLVEKTQQDLIEWTAKEHEWTAPIGKALWVSIAILNDEVHGGHTFRVYRNNEVLLCTVSAAPCLDALYGLVAERVSVENKVLDQLLAAVNDIVPTYPDSAYKD